MYTWYGLRRILYHSLTSVARAPDSGQLCLVFVDLFPGGGGSTAAAVTLDTVADESRKKMADGVTRSPARFCSRDGNICYCGRLEYDFLAFVPCFLLFLNSPA